MAVNLSSIADHLLPGLMGITGEYPQLPAEWRGLFESRKSTLAVERSIQDRFLGMARTKTEGGATPTDNNAGQRWKYSMEPIEVGLMYVITRKAIDDNVYKEAFRPTNLGLQKAHVAFWNAQAASLLNTASTYNNAVGGDGKAILATDHPIDTGTWSNTASTQQQLNETSLLAGMKQVWGSFYDEAGILIDANIEELVIPVGQADVAIRLTESILRPGTANNDPNAIKTLNGGISKGVRTMRYLTNANSWFLKTSVPGLIYLDRVTFEMDMFVDFSTDNLQVKSYERGGMFCKDPRALYGMLP
jgi:hypothetical protein